MTVRPSGWVDDWYMIEHDGGDAAPEGTAAQMLACADAIEQRGRASFRRVAVQVVEDRVQIWSPRNSRRPAEVPYSRALELAREIREVCKCGEKAEADH